MTYSIDEPSCVAMELKLGFVLPVKDPFVKRQLLEADVVRNAPRRIE
jgi:hypothetical protein